MSDFFPYSSDGMEAFQLATRSQLIRKLGGNVNTQPGAGGVYKFLPSDNGNFVYFTAAAPVSPRVPVGLKAGYTCGFVQGGAGQVTPDFTAVTLIPNPHGFTKTFGQGAFMAILAVADDVFVLIGDGA